MMTTEDRKKALTNPSSIVRHPADVVDSRDLDTAEKTRILKQWELDARLLQVASEEGMNDGEHSMFADVKKAQQRLDAPPLREDGAPTKAGP
jgi:hypothetical protein